MPAPVLDHLAVKLAELHADAREAERVAELCRVAAGTRLLEARASVDQDTFAKWMSSGACPVLPATARAMIAAAEQHAEQERVSEPV